MADARITLLTDFGTADGYVAAMKGVIATMAPDARVDDAAHDVAPGDVRAACWTLEAYWHRYPPGTIHVIVVDPGVGGTRRALAAHADGRLFVAPDNGVLTRVFGAHAWQAVSIEPDSGEISATFHGRDVFAPAAARLACGATLDELGTPIDDPVMLPMQPPVRGEGVVRGSVEHVDRFGNLITNVPGDWCAHAAAVRVAGVDVGPVRARYVDAQRGALLALVGSAGVVEIAVRDGSAADTLGVGRDAEVDIQVEINSPASGGPRR